ARPRARRGSAAHCGDWKRGWQMPANEMTVEALLRAHAPHAPETLRRRVLTLEPKQRRVSLPSRRLVLVALPAAIALAVGAAVVRGIVGSRTASPTTTVERVAVAAPAKSKPWHAAVPG